MCDLDCYTFEDEDVGNFFVEVEDLELSQEDQRNFFIRYEYNRL